jgi:MFS family permease
MSMSGICAVFSPNIWIYASMRFVCGFARATVGTCAMVLCTEIVGKKWREFVSVFSFVCFTMGFLSLPMIAYLCRMMSWRYLYLWTAVPSLCYAILVNFFVQESPRFVNMMAFLICFRFIKDYYSLSKSKSYYNLNYQCA